MLAGMMDGCGVIALRKELGRRGTRTAEREHPGPQSEKLNTTLLPLTP